jgi:hypothetical protein
MWLPGQVTMMRFKSQQDADEFQKQITQAALRWGRPVWWYDWRQPFEKLQITGATCFVLKFKIGYVGVTAAHVVKEIFKARQCTPSLDCRIQLMSLFLPLAVIDMNDDLDRYVYYFRTASPRFGSATVRCFYSMASTRWLDRSANADPTCRLPGMLAGHRLRG